MTTTLRPSTTASIETPMDVVTRRRLFFFQEDFSLAPLTYPSFTAQAASYEEYLANLTAALASDLEVFPEVFLAPFRVADYDSWATSYELDPDLDKTLATYLAAFDFEILISVSDPGVVYALATTDYMNNLALAAIHHRLSSGDEDDHLRGLADLKEDGEETADVFTDFLASVVTGTATITYNLEFNVDGSVGNSVDLGGEIAIHRCGDHVHAETAEHNALLSTAFVLSLLSPASFVVRCFEEELHPRSGLPLKTIYGFYVDRDGFKGLNAAQIFDALCTDNEGSPIPPEEGVTYADAPNLELPDTLIS